jgi:hypothetical protein
MRVKLSEFRAAKTWSARHVGISGLGTNPTNPWCQRPCRPPLQTCLCKAGSRIKEPTQNVARQVRELIFVN